MRKYVCNKIHLVLVVSLRKLCTQPTGRIPLLFNLLVLALHTCVTIPVIACNLNELRSEELIKSAKSSPIICSTIIINDIFNCYVFDFSVQ